MKKEKKSGTRIVKTMNIKDYDMNLLKEFILFYKEFDGYENVSELKESELDLIDLFLGERYE